MKKILLFIAIFAVSLNMQAQEKMFVWQNGVKTDFVVTDVDSITFNQLTGNGHEYVDLGLPSGTLWATCNVGATKPEEYGDYFAWGEIEPKDEYSDYTYEWLDIRYETLTKYCINKNEGSVDNRTTLESCDDAAAANWGGNWRMPTNEEQLELINFCTYIWTTKNGISGYELTSKINGKSIFLPAAGSATTQVMLEGIIGHYWSCSLSKTFSKKAYCLTFMSEGAIFADEYTQQNRYEGASVRPITSLNQLYKSSQGEMHIWQNGGKTTFVVADVDSVTFTKDEEITPPTTGTENGYEWVDLGLSVMWATCNVGATKPEEYGDYFAWGETEPKEVYNWSTYTWCNGSANTLTKYNTDSIGSLLDNKTVLDLSDDAARANWGGSWRMPTEAESEELRIKCTWTWTTQNGIYGYKVTSKKNGKSIFLPAAGSLCDSLLYSAGSYGLYWSSSLYTDYPYYAYDLRFLSDYVGSHTSGRDYGHSVRPVKDIDGSNTPNNPNDDPDDSDDPDDPIVITGVTVKAKVPAHWIDLITVWVWPTGGEGEEFIPVREGDWYVYTHTAGTELNIIFKNGFGWTGAHNQTVDITGITQNTCIKIEQEGSGKATYTIVDCLSGEEDEEEDDEKPEKPDTLATGMENGYEWVDLGLSVKWATCNVGATKPEENGDYFAWGETQPKDYYDWSTYKWYNGYITITKYCTDSYYGTVDNKTTLELSDDAARANWGGSWRMPTDAELTELHEQCTWTRTIQNGVSGYKVTSKSNGNSIFLPSAGRHDSSLSNEGSYGYYLSSSLDSDYPTSAWCVLFDSYYVHRCNYDRHYGFSVRPVCP